MSPSKRTTVMRPHAAIGIALLAAAFAAACGGSDDPDPTATAPPERTAPSSSITAAPATAAPDQDGYTANEVFPQLDFDRMLGLIQIPGAPGDALVLTQTGAIYRTTLEAGAAPTIFLDVSDRLVGDPGNEEGLLGLAFAPDFNADGGKFYIYYSADGPRRSVISRFTSDGVSADPASEQVILEVPQPFRNHNGGQMLFGPDGMLYIALGDGGSSGDPQGNAQNTNTLLGSILRIDVTGDAYAVPPDNPFAAGGGRGEIFAYGLRNPWRFTFDRETGDIWAGDVGQDAWEEVDRIVRGGNYGWNVLEGDACVATDDCGTEGFVAPRAVYARADGNCAVTGGYVYRGDAMPELDGWYVYGDYCSGRVWAFDTEDDSSAPVLLTSSEQAISSFAEDTDGELYLVTFNNAIFKLERR